MAAETIKGAYYPSWVDQNQFPPSNINAKLFTHIYYAFVIPDPNTFVIEINNETGSLLHNFTSTLHHANPRIKVMLSIGGADKTLGLTFAQMASTSRSRNAFIQSSISVARKYSFDGLDLHWEFPQNSTEMDNFGLLLKEWRAAEVNREAGGQPLLLAAAVYYRPTIAHLNGATYPSNLMAENLDWINVMTYDYCGSWSNFTGAPAALYDPTGTGLSTKDGLNSWINDAGVPKNKLIMGLPLYGKTWKLQNPNVNGIGAPAAGVGPGQDGVMTYFDVVAFNQSHNIQGKFDEPTVSVYSVVQASWIGYDDVRSTTKKNEYARELGLRGYFLWQVASDYQWTISQAASDAWN